MEAFADVLAKYWSIFIFFGGTIATIAVLFYRVGLIEKNKVKEDVEKEKHVEDVEKDFRGMSTKVEGVNTELQKKLDEQNKTMAQNHLQVIEKIAELRGFKMGQESRT